MAVSDSTAAQRLLAKRFFQEERRRHLFGTTLTKAHNIDDLIDQLVESSRSYQDYLERQLTPIDGFFIDNESVRRQLVEHGLLGVQVPLDVHAFERRRKLLRRRRLQSGAPERRSTNPTDAKPHSAVVDALLQREAENRRGRLRSLLFVRAATDAAGGGGEVSSFIDYSSELVQPIRGGRDWNSILQGETLIEPSPDLDLSFCNFVTGRCVANEPTGAFALEMSAGGRVADGLTFVCRDDHHVSIPR